LGCNRDCSRLGGTDKNTFLKKGFLAGRKKMEETCKVASIFYSAKARPQFCKNWGIAQNVIEQ